MPFYFLNSPEFSEVAFSPPVLRRSPVSLQQLVAQPQSLSYRSLYRAASLCLIRKGNREQILIYGKEADVKVSGQQ